MEMVNTNIKSLVKHLGRKIYWVREYIACSNVIVEHVDGTLNLADIFTQYVTNQVLEKLRPAVMGGELPPSKIDNNVGAVWRKKVLKGNKKLKLHYPFINFINDEILTYNEY